MLKTALIRVALAALVAVIGVTALTVLVFWVLVLGQIWPSAEHQISPGVRPLHLYQRQGRTPDPMEDAMRKTLTYGALVALSLALAPAALNAAQPTIVSALSMIG